MNSELMQSTKDESVNNVKHCYVATREQTHATCYNESAST